MRDSAQTVLDSSPAMSAYSERDAPPPSDGGFSLPPISLKMTPSPSSNTSELEYEEVEDVRVGVGGHHRDVPSSFSSRASSFMFSRRSSRLSNLSASPTKLPTIDRNKSNSVASLNSSRSSHARRSFREAKIDRLERGDLCKSPSCPTLQWDEYEDSGNGSINGDIQVSVHPPTARQYGGDDMRLPDIFSSGKTKQDSKRDSSLPPLSNGDITPRMIETQRERGRKGRRDSLTFEPSNFHSAGGNLSGGSTPRVDPNPGSGGGGFLVPISESDKVTGKQKTHKQQKKNKVSPKQRMEYDVPSDRHLNGITGLLHIEPGGESLPQVGHAPWDIKEEDESLETDSAGSFDETRAIEEIARENKVLTNTSASGRKQKKSGSKTKKQR